MFDNTERAELLEEYWPSGVGRVLVTARSSIVGYQLGCVQIEIQTFDKEVGLQLMLNLLARRKVSHEEENAARELVERLSGHALAIDQMTALIKSQGHSISTFLKIYDTRAKKLHRTHRSTRPSEDSHFLDTVWLLSFHKLKESPVAFGLLGMLAFLVPDSIPRQLFQRGERFEACNDLEYCKDELE